MKTYKIQTSKSGRGVETRVNVQEGTLEELIKYFSYTLEIGNSWNKKISMNPKTINSLVKNLQMSYEEKEGESYSRTSVSLLTTLTKKEKLTVEYHMAEHWKFISKINRLSNPDSPKADEYMRKAVEHEESAKQLRKTM